MDKLLRRITGFLIALVLVLTGFGSTVHARLMDNVSTQYVDDDYNVVTEFYEGLSGQGEIVYKVTADLSEVDEVYIPYSMVVLKCCGNQSIPRTNYVNVRINGRSIYYSDDIKPIDAFVYMTYGDRASSTVNIKNYRSANAQIEYDICVRAQRCQACGTIPDVQFKNGGLKFYDLRAKATNVPKDISVQSGGKVNIGYTFSYNTTRVVWGIRRAGEQGFTPLTEGTNKDGLIATGVNSKVLNLTNIPQSINGYEIGAFAYDEEGKLPGGTAYPDTPFFTKINVTDGTAPVVDVKKTIDTGSKSVIVEIIASDENGLHEKPYSFDGGKTYEAGNRKAFTTPGIYRIAVRDKNGNVTTKDISIDSIEIEKANPKSPADNPDIKDKETDTGKGSSGGGTDTPGGPGGTPGSSPGTGGNNPGTPSPGEFEKIKDKEKEYVSGNTEVKDTVKTVEETKKTQDDKNTKNTSKNTPLNAKNISDKDLNDTFERIRKNSEEYIISMRETKKEEPKGANDNSSTVEVKKLDEDGDTEAYKNNNGEDKTPYKPGSQRKSNLYLIAAITGVLILLALLAIILFFGVIVFVKKDTEYTALSDSDGIKVPVALLFVSFGNGERSICFGELLNKYETLYVRFGALFSYIYENDKISIMTKFKGEKKREIAKEIIGKEIVIGKKGAKRK